MTENISDLINIIIDLGAGGMAITIIGLLFYIKELKDRIKSKNKQLAEFIDDLKHYKRGDK